MITYLDNAATTRVCPEAAQAALNMMTEVFGNPSSTHQAGRAARDALKNARQLVARSMDAAPEEIYFTASGSEGDNWAIRCGAHHMRHKGRHIITSLAEHSAVKKSVELLQAEGYEATFLKPGTDGAIHPEEVLAALHPDTVLISLMLVNNETGAVTDIEAIVKAVRAAGSEALIHTDAVQGFLKVPCSARKLKADMITVSGHKVHAPKGSGALYIRRGLSLPAFILGGGQENGRRSGTEALPSICAFAEAVRAGMEDREAPERMAGLRTLAADTLKTALGDDMVVIGGGAPQILCLSLPGYRSEVILNLLDAEGICVSKGSACKKGARSHVLEAMELPVRVIDGAIRVSLCRYTTEEDIQRLCAGLIKAHDTLMHR